MKKLYLAPIIFLLLFLVCSQGGAQERVRIAYSAISGAMLTPWVGLEAGIFKKNGLRAELVYIAGGSTAAAALLGGDVELIVASGDGVVRSRLQGIDLVSFADMTSTLVFSLMSRPEIVRPQDLKGKKLGVTRFGTSTHAAMLAALKHFQIGEGDVALLQMGGIPQILAALEARSLSAGVLSPPANLRAKKTGMRELLDIGSLKIPFQMNTFIAKGEFIQKNPELMRRLARSIVQAIHRIKTDPAFSERILAKYTKIEDTEILRETYRTFATNYLARAPYPSEDAVRLRLAELSAKEERARSANPKDFVDPRWIKEVDENGFISRLYNP